MSAHALDASWNIKEERSATWRILQSVCRPDHSTETAVCNTAWCLHSVCALTWRQQSVHASVSLLFVIRSVRRSLSRHALLSLVRALVISKVDYCSSVGRNIRKSHTPVTVRHECCRTSRILGEEIQPHHAVTPLTALAEGSREDPVLVGRAILPVPAQHCTGIPHRVTATGPWCGCSTTCSLCCMDHDAGHTCDALFNAAWVIVW